ncbi:MAG TPA: glycosyltransferase [Longimicrobiales bacterium]|nr:glycosyltransferase [Longimicrobiales bacterium]
MGRERIPRILHQTWKTTAVPRCWRAARESWLAHHPDWEHRFWTDEDLDRLVRTRAPDLYPLWKRYPYDIQRVDAARYVMLREYGGAYADLDVVCLKPFHDLLEHELVLARTRPLGITNQLMLARPGHPLMERALQRLPASFRRWQRRALPRHFRVLLTTGPLFLTGCMRAHGPSERERMLTLDEHGHGRMDRSYVRHIPGGSWEEWDSRALCFVHDHWELLASTGVAGAAILSLLE